MEIIVVKCYVVWDELLNMHEFVTENYLRLSSYSEAIANGGQYIIKIVI